MSKETLCWYCKNACGKCSWSNGTFTPVNGWEVDETKQLKTYKDKSYTVTKCPEYKEFYKQLSNYDIAEIIGISPRSVARLDNYNIKRMCKLNGKKLYISRTNKQRVFYLLNNDEEMGS